MGRRVTRVRVAIIAAVAVCAVAGAMLAISSAGDDGPRSFVARDNGSAVLIEWTRVGDDLSGSMTQARLVNAAPDRPVDSRLADEVPRDVQRDTSPFTGTISDRSVRLQFSNLLSAGQVNGRLDDGALKLTIAGSDGLKTVQLSRASREEFNAAITQLRSAEVRRGNTARTKRERADAVAQTAITRVATAYQAALDPSSPDDPCRYLTADAKAELLGGATAALAARGCKAVVRLRERELHRAPYPKKLGPPKIDLRQVIDVPSQSTGGLAGGAEVRFPAIPNQPIGVLQDEGQWRIAKYE